MDMVLTYSLATAVFTAVGYIVGTGAKELAVWLHRPKSRPRFIVRRSRH